MDSREVAKNLCYYDKRNPEGNFVNDPEYYEGKPVGDCSCDNCFYGRTELAEEIIRLSK